MYPFRKHCCPEEHRIGRGIEINAACIASTYPVLDQSAVAVIHPAALPTVFVFRLAGDNLSAPTTGL